MSTGMLWFDNDPKLDFESKINRAKEYYLRKYGQKPNLCFVHPSVSFIPPSKASGIDVKTDKMILPNHFWIGIKGAAVSN